MMKYRFLIVFILLQSLYLQAQHVREFHDAFGLKGITRSTSAWSDTLLPEKGNFTLTWRRFDHESLVTYRAEGILKNYLPTGRWVWEEVDWDYSIEPGRTIAPVFSTRGLHHVWEGLFKEGVPQGRWVYTKGEAPLNVSRRGAAPVLRIQADFHRGRLFGKFEIRDLRNAEPRTILGEADSMGLATGTWVFQFTQLGEPMIEKRHYDRGILLRIERTHGEHQEEFEYSANKHYLSAMDDPDAPYEVRLSAMDFDEDEQSSPAVRHYSNYVLQYFMRGWQLPELPLQFERRMPAFKRFVFPLSVQEHNTIAVIGDKNNRLREKIGNLLHSGNIRINRIRNAELDLAIAMLEQAGSQQNLIDTLIALSGDPDFIYINRMQGGLNDFLLRINQAGQVEGEVYDLKDELPLIEMRRQNYRVFDLLNYLLDDLDAMAHAQKEVIDINILLMRREGELHDLEQEMSFRLERIDSLYEGYTGLKKHIHEYWIRQYLFEYMQTYANTDDYESAIELGHLLIAKMDSLATWSTDWYRINELSEELEKSYVNLAYNPYTGETDIILPLKRRFVAHIREYLLPFLINRLETTRDWDELQALFAQTLHLRQELIRYARLDERTDKRLDKRIRRETDPERILRLFLQYMEGR